VFTKLSGETSYTNAGGGTIFADEASTPRTMGPVR
jgi:hypothetical protein